MVADYSNEYSHWNAFQSLGSWLKKCGVPAVTGIDTRAVIKHIRKSGVLLGKLVHSKDKVRIHEATNISISISISISIISYSNNFQADEVQLVDPNKANLVAEVSTKQVKNYGTGDTTIMLVDCGMKFNQIRCFLSRGVTVKVVPWNYDFVSDRNYDGLFLSNGPGDPTMCAPTIKNLKKLIEEESHKEWPIPIFGICLGNQVGFHQFVFIAIAISMNVISIVVTSSPSLPPRPPLSYLLVARSCC